VLWSLSVYVSFITFPFFFDSFVIPIPAPAVYRNLLLWKDSSDEFFEEVFSPLVFPLRQTPAVSRFFLYFRVRHRAVNNRRPKIPSPGSLGR